MLGRYTISGDNVVVVMWLAKSQTMLSSTFSIQIDESMCYGSMLCESHLVQWVILIWQLEWKVICRCIKVEFVAAIWGGDYLCDIDNLTYGSVIFLT